MFFSTTLTTIFALLLTTLPLITAHQTLQQLWINNATPGPKIGIRTPPNNSPVKDLASPSLVCNVGGTKTPSGVQTLPAPAGSKIKVQWSTFVHMGPITHMLYGPVADASQTSGEGAGWFKIDELDSVGGKWASQVMIGENYTHEFSLPEGLPEGEYLLRSEMVALHNAQLVGGAEFYVGCAQLKVEGGKGSGKGEKGGKGAACGPTISLPGAYKAEDKSVYIPDVYSGFKIGSYKAPGGPVAVCGGGNGGGSGGDGIPASNSTVPPSGSPTLPSASSSAPTGFATLVRPSAGAAAPTGAVPKASVGVAKIWDKCGGQGFTGPTTCEGSAKCVKQTEWYSQCVQ